MGVENELGISEEERQRQIDQIPIKKPMVYCFKCKKKVEVNEMEMVELKSKGDSKRSAIKGRCSICNGSVFEFLRKK